MKRIGMSIVAAALLLQFQVAAADDPPARADDPGDASGSAMATKEAAPAPKDAATDTIRVEEVPNGAASMEPAQQETPEERSERAFLENVWDSP
ncbi:MAG: hypothetical protein WB493_08770 [Anaeromyxobacteraceae bacterium]